MARKTKSALALPQTDDQWYCAVRKLRTFVQVDEESEKYARPYVIIVIDLMTGLLVMADIVAESIPAQELNNKLVEVMVKPPKGSERPAHRPAEIHFEDEALVEAIQPLLSEIGVTARFLPRRENMDKIIRDLEKLAYGNAPDEIPGLLKKRGVKPEFVGSLFAAAAAFYRAEPWVQLSNQDILAVQVKNPKSPYFVIVLGQGGEEYGLSVFRNWQEVETFFGASHPLDAITSEGKHALLFSEPPFVSFDDLDAIETYHWELPAPDLIPTPAIYLPLSLKRPDVAMLRWYEAVLRAIPAFVAGHLETKPDGTHPPAEATIEVQTYAGIIEVHIRYPGGDLSAVEQRYDSDFEFPDDLNEEELEPIDFDLRGMEGAMAQLAGEIGAVPQISDPALQKAQQMMYDAWEEPSPAKRIALAKKALKMSPNCADAHVLLAEEEAQTARQALTHYEAGVEAGRRALGEDFLTDPHYVGHFWGIFETRPYMRALEGLATTQWELGQREEAARNFRELLRLNPMDNQGVRYSLLNLQLELGQDEPARALLKEYNEDGSTEGAYTLALLAFRESGDSPEARQVLKDALSINAYVPDYLTGKKRIPAQQYDTVTYGGADEAAYYASEYLKHWRKTPGAIDWLKANLAKGK